MTPEPPAPAPGPSLVHGTGEGGNASPPPPSPVVHVRLPTHSARVTYALLALIILTFLAQIAARVFFGFDLIIELGAKENTLIAHGELWRLLTPIFIHASLLHIAFNVYALYYLGQQMETFYGPARFTLLFFIAGLSGSVISLLLNPAPSVGASGAIFGLIGAEGVLLYRNRRVFGERGRRTLQNLVGLVVLNLFIGLQGGIDNWAHLGGLLAGLGLGWVIGPVWPFDLNLIVDDFIALEDQQPLTSARWAAIFGILLALATLTGIAVALRR